MRRREFLILTGAAAVARPALASGQQTAVPTIGFLGSASPGPYATFVASFLHGLNEAGFVEGRNFTIDYRWAEGQYDRLPAMAAELVRRRVALILATGGNAPAQAAKEATTDIPIVFISGGDPVRAGLVASLSRPGGNVTGISFIATALVAKRLELLHQLVPKAAAVGALVNPNYPDNDLQLSELRESAEAIKQQIHIVSAGTEGDIDRAFAVLVQQKSDALLVANDPFLGSLRAQIIALAALHAIPAIYPGREYAAAGGLISYGSDLADGYREAGIYVGRILKGAKPTDLPVEQPTRFELVINLKTAKALGLTIPQSLLATADEVIE